MKKRNWFLFLVVSVFILALAACQQADPKGSYAAAYKKLAEAEKYDFSSDIGLKVDASNMGAEDKQVAEILNNLKLTVSGKTDSKTKQSEIVLKGQVKVENMTMNFDVPVFMDEKKQVGYIKLDSVLDNFGIFLGTAGMNFDSLKGKYLEFPLEEDQSSSGETEEIQKKLMDSIKKAADNLSSDQFKQADLTDKEKEQGASEKFTFSLNDEEIKKALVKIIEIIGEASEKTLSKEDLNNVKDNLKDLTFKKYKVTTTLDDKKNILSEKADISIDFDIKDFPASIGITTNSSFKEIDGDVTFSHKPKKADIVTEEEAEKLMANDAMNF
ncbi:hypothetical protein OZL92_05570 [Bacillus sonorensis]|uniref:Lipoprotein n=2 Tax=Bacillus sonorensis TaxID=119858 RepID=M5P9Y2_9BACI|nr:MULTISPECIES: hypothetical protein [Bacillus]TWK82317.1 hypothetical protein CHCC20335_3360 [Bacillus paralicheniformis]ASB88930.1 hypothetical protein S101395_02423 [Bacillus sonorensis]EME76263.1 hypothetical protein BSONL12_00722 [Bacillus sonorensis L12]MBG9915298.1 hypothetical protein [Bacillus sonorensis]MCF7618278.1 hypothetical protein [Bacillus sonorensis]